MFNKFLKLLPLALILGLLDFRFHNYFWPNWDWVRPVGSWRMFDFFSVWNFYVAALVIAFVVGRAYVPRRLPRWTWAVLGLTCLGVLVAAFSYTPVEPHIKSLPFQLGMNYVGPMLVFLMMVFSKPRGLGRSLVFTFGGFGAICLLQFLTGWFPGEATDFLGRLAWPYVDPFYGMTAESANWLAYLFGPVFLLGAVLWTRKRKWPMGVATVICGLVLLLTKSYTGVGIAFVLLAWWIYLNLEKAWRKWFWLGLVVVLAVGVVTQYDSPKFQILLGNYPHENSIERRSHIYAFNAAAFSEAPLTGIGPGNYQSYFRDNQLEFTGYEIPEHELPVHAHNLIMNAWSDLGLAGMIAMIILYVMAFKGAVWERLKNPYWLAFSYPLGHGLMDTPYGLEETSVMFWVLLGLILMHKHSSNLLK